VDDDPRITRGVAGILGAEGYRVDEAFDGHAAIRKLDAGAFDLLLLDLQLPRIHGLDVLRHVSACQPELQVIVVTGVADVATAVRTVQLGACDLIEKPLGDRRLLEIVRKALGDVAERRDSEVSAEDALVLYGMVGASGATRSVFDQINRAAASDVPVLITGESGSGKEKVARAIARQGPRAGRPFVTVNCAAIPPELVESELFGHERGAFTGAHARHIGVFEQASGGTLFLDEVGDLAPGAQAKLLRVLESSPIRRVGGSAAIEVDVRVIAATNRDPAADVASGRFREDLYYRLNVLPIRIPPLRDRPDDVPVLAAYFLRARAEAGARAVPALTDAAVRVLTRHDWPGNARELRNVVDRLILFADTAPISGRDALRAVRGGPVHHEEAPAERPLREKRDDWERDEIRRTLIGHGWRIQETADSLGLSRSHLWRRMRDLGIRPDA
jgi:DNA-binding NtrC family response regulator